MRKPVQGLCLLVGAIALIGVIGCETSSHSSVSTYEYSDDRRAFQRENPREDAELNSEYRMVSPGEMVVEPRR